MYEGECQLIYQQWDALGIRDVCVKKPLGLSASRRLDRRDGTSDALERFQHDKTFEITPSHVCVCLALCAGSGLSWARLAPDASASLLKD